VGVIDISIFGGMQPAAADELLPGPAASFSQNTWLYSGQLVGMREPKSLHVCALPQTSKVFRLPKDPSLPVYMYESFWMEFSNFETDVILAPVFDDIYYRIYWASSNTSPKYNTRARILAGQSPWLLGVPAPLGTPTLGISGGSSTVNRSTSYVTTFVTAYGEEGPPSPPVTGTGKVDATWAVVLPPADPADLGTNRNITKTRLYRTVVSMSGTASYYLVVELTALATTQTYNDTQADSTVVQRASLESVTWSGPPADLLGFCMMSNGILAGWRENELWLSEPYRPHAWPAGYALTTEFPIVGLGTYGQSLVACTQGYPEVFTGVAPSSISASRLSQYLPCNSRGSILSGVDGVYYTSTHGLVLIGSGGANLITDGFITADQWVNWTQGTRLRCARLGEAYYAYGEVEPRVFQDDAFQTGVINTPTAYQQDNYSGSRIGVLVDAKRANIAFNMLASDDPVFDVQNDAWSGEAFFIRNNTVYWQDQADLTLPVVAGIWRSKQFQMSKKRNLAALRVYFKKTPNVIPAEYGTVAIYADGRLVVTHNLAFSGQLMRVPSGFKADYWQIEFNTQLQIMDVQLGTSVKALMAQQDAAA
jgi:hypothetical protein